jgi:hypothetical protein
MSQSENMSKEQYLNECCAIYTLKFRNCNTYFLLFNNFEDFGKAIRDYFTENMKKNLNIFRKDQEVFAFESLNCLSEQNFEEDLEFLKSQSLVKEICESDNLKQKAFLVKYDGDYFIYFDVQPILDDPEFKVLGAFLMDTDQMYKYLEANQNEVMIEEFRLEIEGDGKINIYFNFNF